MAQLIEENLLEVIVKDDVKAFNAMMENAQCGSYRLGRFPVLSIMYLYKSRKILSAYEEKFIKITSWEPLREPASVAKAFSDKAGKCLRLYLNETVSPLEMLLILDMTRKLKRVYPLTKPSGAVKDRLQSIYSVKYSLNIKYEGNGIILDRRPLSRGEKKRIATLCLCIFLALAIVIATPITAVALVPQRAEGEVTKLSHINFNKKTTYTLKNDITIPENYKVEKMNCTIVGGGRKITVGKGASLGELSGKMKDLEIISSGSPIFTSISDKGGLSSVRVNVTADIQTAESSAFIALTNNGAIDGVTVNVSGKVSAIAGSNDGTEELTFGGMVLNNSVKYSSTGQPTYAVINKCTVNYSNFTLEGEAYANGVFAGIAGINSGIILDSTVTGSVTSETFDLAGVCSTNNYGISGVVNEATLIQTSPGDGWNPIVCGIAVNNMYVIEYSENRGDLVSRSTCGQVDNSLSACAGGIAYINDGRITNTKNTGNVTAEGSGEVIAGGIAVSSTYLVEYSENDGAVSAKTNGNGDNSPPVYAGGIAFINTGSIAVCKSAGAVTAEGNGVAYAGGICARSYDCITYCISVCDITVTARTVYAGGIFGTSEIMQNFYVYCGYAEYCISESKIKASGEEISRVGGIGGFVLEGRFVDDSENILGYFGGGANNCFFLGSIDSDDYFGNIVGVCGENIYNETNLYYTDRHSFENNYHLKNSLPSFGASVTLDGDNKEQFAPIDGESFAREREEIEKTEAYIEIVKKFA